MSHRQRYGASMQAIPTFVAHHSEHPSVTGILPLASTYAAALGHVTGCCARAARLLSTGQEQPDVQESPSYLLA